MPRATLTRRFLTRYPSPIDISGGSSDRYLDGFPLSQKSRTLPTYWSLEDLPNTETSTKFLQRTASKIREALSSVVSQHQINALPFSREGFRADPYSAFEEFCSAIEAVGPPRGVLLILDEFDKLLSIAHATRERQESAVAPFSHDEALQPEVFGALRKMIMGGRVIRVVVAGLPRLTRQSYDERFFGTLEPVPVAGFTDDEAKRVIAAASGTMRLLDDAERELLRATGAQPYLLQVVCHALFCAMISEGRDLVTLGDVRDVIDREVLPNQTYFTDFLSLLDEQKRRVVRALARLHREAPWRGFVSVGDIERELEAEGRAENDVLAVLEELKTDERPLVERAPNNLTRFRLKIGLIGDQLLAGDQLLR